MSVFGKNDKVTCVLIPMEGMAEDEAMFEALLDVDKSRRGWRYRIFWADQNETHKVLILCKTQAVKDSVKVLAGIDADRIELRKKQAKQNNLTFFVTKIGDKFTMVYY